MSEREQGKSTSGESDLVLELNFVPQWARKPADEVRYGSFDDRGSRSSRGGGGGGRPRGGSGGGRGARGGRSSEPRGNRPPPRRGDSGGPSQDRRPARPAGGGGAPQSYSPNRNSGGARDSYRQEPIQAAPINIRFLPEQQALVGLVRQVSSTKRAYPLIDLANLLMSKPGCCFVKLDVDSPSPDTIFYQCKECRTIAMDRTQIESHILLKHRDLYFDTEEVLGEPPSGTFVCVAKCGFSGTLLGPPNHHSYADAVRRLHASRFAHMDIESYKDRIQLSHEPDDVERWKVEASSVIECRRKEGTEEEREPIRVADADRYMQEQVIPKLLSTTKRAVVSEAVAHEIQDSSIKRALREEWQHESRFPLKVSFALRAAFKHKHLYVFKAGKGRGVNFVTSVEPLPLDPEHAIPSISEVLTYLREHPGCKRQDMVAALRPDAEPDSESVKELLQPLHWLIERGHILEFFNGTLSVPLVKRR